MYKLVEGKKYLRNLIPILKCFLGVSFPFFVSNHYFQILGGWLRNDFNFIFIFVLFIFFYVIYQIDSIYNVDLIGFVIGAIFGFILLGLWGNAASELQVVGGHLFFSDAHQYYTDAVRLLNNFSMSSFSARHPLPTVFLSSLLLLFGGNLGLSLFVEAWFISISVYFVIKELLHQISSIATAFFAMLIILFSRRFIGVPCSENLGIILGCLSFLFLWRYKNFFEYKNYLFGIFLLVLALVARPGPFIVIIPLFLLYGKQLYTNKNILRKEMFLFLFIVIAIFGYQAFLINNFSEDNSRLFGNFSYSLYGIANGGTGWEQFLIDYPELKSHTTLIQEQKALHTSWLVFKNNPMLTINGIVSTYLDFFSLNDESIFGFLADGTLFTNNQSVDFKNNSFWMVTRFFVMALAFRGLINAWIHRQLQQNQILISMIIGLLLSLPFLPSQDAGIMRVYAAVIPWIIVIPSIGLNFSSKEKLICKHERLKIQNSIVYFLFIIILLLSPVFLISRYKTINDFQNSSICEENKEVVIFRLYPGTILLISDGTFNNFPGFFVANPDKFKSSIINFHRSELIAPLTGIQNRSLVASTFDFQTKRIHWIIIPENLLSERPSGQLVKACGSWNEEFLELGYGFFVVNQMETEKNHK